MSRQVQKSIADYIHKAVVTGVAGLSVYLAVNTVFLYQDARDNIRAKTVRISAPFNLRRVVIFPFSSSQFLFLRCCLKSGSFPSLCELVGEEA